MANHISLSHADIAKLIEAFASEEVSEHDNHTSKEIDIESSDSRRPGKGRRWATTPNEDRYLVLTARRDRNMNATLLQQHLRSATGSTISTQSVRNLLHGVGVFSSGGTVEVGIILRSCKKVSDLAVGECWCMVASALTGAHTSTSFEMDL
ncbi:transposable element Tcb2 transposase [Trichonephila clavipes]|uniref:Transposable element Tcb2 transposase n=1 Tax=Trichonephila clavipes TaxID=2585209 RepID=A0A8X6SF99_TRICX|nr:transposable element Tcb2 transposase [Trichonephila clavipes]